MASRKEQKERLKAERLQREQQAQSTERRKRLVGWGAGGVLVVGVLVALLVVILAGGDGDGPAAGGPQADADAWPAGSVPPQQTADLQQAVRASGCDLQQNPSEGNSHTQEPVEYEQNPPNSGDHHPIPVEDGAYAEAPSLEQLVHSHEHGRIIIQFDPSLPDSAQGDLKALYDEDPYHMILTPSQTDMPYEVAATTWTRTLGCPELNEDAFDAIRAFRDEYRDEGPEFVP